MNNLFYLWPSLALVSFLCAMGEGGVLEIPKMIVSAVLSGAVIVPLSKLTLKI